MKTITKFTPFQYQRETIEKVVNMINLHGSACIFDETGLGKTIEAATVAINLFSKILVVCPAKNKKTWNKVLSNTNIDYKVCSYMKFPEENYELVIIDEAHNYTKHTNKTHKKLFRLIQLSDAKVLLLTATPFQNKISQLHAMFSMCNFKSESPMYVLLGHILERLQTYEKQLDSYYKQIEGLDIETLELKDKNKNLLKSMEDLKTILPLFCVINTRNNVMENYKGDVELMGKFPIADKQPMQNNYDTLLLTKTISCIRSLRFPTHNIKAYVSEFNSKSTSMQGLMQTFLFKRLDSSVAAFKSSLEGLLERLKKEVLRDNLNTVTINGETYEANDSYEVDISLDISVLGSMLDMWSEVTDQAKLDKLIPIVKKGKTIIFTEYNDTLDVLETFCIKNKLRYLKFNAQTNDKLLNTIEKNFDANYTSLENDYDVLIATDVLSEGVSLHAANALVHFDLKWNHSKLLQREGRINRIVTSKLNHNKVTFYTFYTGDVIEAIIELNYKVQKKSKVLYDILNFNTPPTFEHNFSDSIGELNYGYVLDDKPFNILEPSTYIGFRTNLGDVFFNERIIVAHRQDFKYSLGDVKPKFTRETILTLNGLHFPRMFGSSNIHFSRLYFLAMKTWYEEFIIEKDISITSRETFKASIEEFTKVLPHRHIDMFKVAFVGEMQYEKYTQ